MAYTDSLYQEISINPSRSMVKHALFSVLQTNHNSYTNCIRWNFLLRPSTCVHIIYVFSFDSSASYSKQCVCVPRGRRKPSAYNRKYVDLCIYVFFHWSPPRRRSWVKNMFIDRKDESLAWDKVVFLRIYIYRKYYPAMCTHDRIWPNKFSYFARNSLVIVHILMYCDSLL